MELSAIMSVGKSNADITEHIIPISNSKFKLDFQAKLSEPTENWASFGRFVLPAKEKTVWVDGKPVQLLANNLKTLIFSKKDAREIRFPIAGGGKAVKSISPLVRYDSMNDHSDGVRNAQGVLGIDDYARSRITGGVTISLGTPFVSDIRLNYEKYFYREGAVPDVSEQDKFVIEFMVRF